MEGGGKTCEAPGLRETLQLIHKSTTGYHLQGARQTGAILCNSWCVQKVVRQQEYSTLAVVLSLSQRMELASRSHNKKGWRLGYMERMESDACQLHGRSIINKKESGRVSRIFFRSCFSRLFICAPPPPSLPSLPLTIHISNSLESGVKAHFRDCSTS